MGKPKKQASTVSQPDPFKEQVDALTRDYIVEPRLGEGSMLWLLTLLCRCCSSSFWVTSGHSCDCRLPNRRGCEWAARDRGVRQGEGNVEVG